MLYNYSMAKRKKLFTYKFIDEERQFNSNLIVTCTETGEKVKMYHKHLYKLIKNKYSNNWKLFKATYVKKGNKPNLNELDDYDIRPEGYRKYLITAFMECKKSNLSETDKAAKFSFLNDCYQKRWTDTLENRIKLMEQ